MRVDGTESAINRIKRKRFNIKLHLIFSLKNGISELKLLKFGNVELDIASARDDEIAIRYCAKFGITNGQISSEIGCINKNTSQSRGKNEK